MEALANSLAFAAILALIAGHYWPKKFVRDLSKPMAKLQALKERARIKFFLVRNTRLDLEL